MTSRLLALDGLRALAIAGVIGIHAGFAMGGHLGVSVFFVLSGFLITWLLASELDSTSSLDFRGFYARRAIRLIPALLVAVTATGIVTIGLAPSREIFAGAAAAITYTTNLFETVGVNGHVALANFVWPWTLSLEEQFYLLWPALLLLLMRRNPRYAEAVAASGFLISTALRFVVPIDGPAEPAQLYFGPHTRASGLMLGCWLALMLRRRPEPRTPLWLPTVAAPAAVLVIVASYWTGNLRERSTYTLWLTLVELATALLIYAVVRAPDCRLARSFSWWPLAYLGQISYGIYLWNIAAATLTGRFLHPESRVVALLEWGPLTLLVAALSFHFFERPLILALRRRQSATRVEEHVAAP